MKQLYNLQSLDNLQDIIENDISIQAMEFQFEAPKHNWPMPYGVFLGEMFRCLDEYVEAGNIEPIQELSTTAITGWQDDTIINKYMAFANLQLADKFLKANNIYKAMQYYKRGITYKNLKSTTDIENDIMASKYKDAGKKAADARWQGHVEQLRIKYLELDQSRQNELGKNLTIKAVANWIYEYHNDQDLEFETIRDHLSKARKGVFTN
ncbi:hypothetical protein [Psychrobacter sp. S4(2024)]|uniref:hypothetical protein n=1 Tax=Psychrobacter sp. S4(2024) TaxID=3111913 RepID=UPI002FE157DD